MSGAIGVDYGIIASLSVTISSSSTSMQGRIRSNSTPSKKSSLRVKNGLKTILEDSTQTSPARYSPIATPASPNTM